MTPPPETADEQTRSQHWAQSLSDRFERWPAGARHVLVMLTSVFCAVLVLFIIVVPFEFYAQ